MMRAFTSFPLDDDIVDHLLTFMPDFATLQSMISVSKAVYAVFKTHQHSILCTVAENVIGSSALPMALRLVRFREDWFHVLDLPKEDDVVAQHLTTDEVCELRDVFVDDTRALEDLFSSRHKQRDSSRTRLSPVEATRFTRALYRLWLYSSLFGLSRHDFGDERDDDLKEVESNAQMTFLEAFSTPELLEMDRVAVFLSESLLLSDSYARTMVQDAVYWTKLANVATPDEVLRIDENLHFFFGHDLTKVDDEEVVVQRIQRILTQRKVPYNGITYKGTILDSVEGPYGKCSYCDGHQETELWSETNWHLLHRFICRESLMECLKGNLLRNVADTQSFRNTVGNMSDVPWSEIMNDMFDDRTMPYILWTRQDAVCLQCVRRFIEAHLHFWLLACKRRAGETIHEDCWYGYNCRTQTHKLSHAQRLNHLCEPTRGHGA